MSYPNNTQSQVTSWPCTTNYTEFDDLIHPHFSPLGSQQFTSPESETSIIDPMPRYSTQGTNRRSSTLLESRDTPYTDNDLCYDGLRHTPLENHPPPIGLPRSEYVKSSHHYGERLSSYEGNVPLTSSEDMKQPIHQQFLSDCHINTEKNLLKSQHLPRPYSSPESKAISEKARRKRAHNLIEKRSRENLNLKFLELEKVLSRHRGPGQNKDLTPDNTPKRKKRLAILDRAHNNILELEAEVQSLKQKIKTLRDIAFPETCRFTLPVD